MSGFQGIIRTHLPAPINAQERIDNVVRELKKRGAANDYCIRCGTFDWSVDFLEISARPATLEPTIPEPQSIFHPPLNFAQPVPAGFIPMVCIVCKNCGYTMFHNLNVLEQRNRK